MVIKWELLLTKKVNVHRVFEWDFVTCQKVQTVNKSRLFHKMINYQHILMSILAIFVLLMHLKQLFFYQM